MALHPVLAATHPPLPGIFGSIAPLINHHGYLAVGSVVLLANIGLPLPAEAAVVTGAVFATTGQLDLVAVAAVAAITAAIGSGIGYLIGSRAGHPLLISKGRRIGITAERLSRAEGFFARRGLPLVVIARFLPMLRRLCGLTAGVSEMPWPQFAIGNIVGAAGWAAAWVAIGNQAGSHLSTLSRILSGRYLAIAAAIVVVAAIVIFLRRSKPTHPAEVISPTEDPAWIA